MRALVTKLNALLGVVLMITSVAYGQVEEYLEVPPDGKDRFSAEQAQGMVSGLIAPYDFSDATRDPFVRPELLQPPEALPAHGPYLPLQYFDVGALRVRAILWSVRQPRALIETPDGKSYTVTLGERLGNKNGYIALIREGEVVVVETEERDGESVSSTQVMTIHR